MIRLCSLTSTLIALLLIGRVLLADPDGPAATAEDEKVLTSVGLKTDVASLLTFFRKRSPTEADRREIIHLVRQLGHDRFHSRDEASAALLAWGVPALDMLRQASSDSDAEVARRARACVEDIEHGPGPLLPMAAARLLVQRRPAGACGVLLTYLPYADDDDVVEEVCRGLLALNSDTGKLDPKMFAALTNPEPVLRRAAAYVIGRRGSSEQREGVIRLLSDRDPRVRFQSACALLTARDRRALPALVTFLGDGPLELAWQAEDILTTLAGTDAPGISVSSAGEQGRHRVLAAWQTWYSRHGSDANLALYAEAQRLLGLTLGVEYNTGRVWECGMDGILRWQLGGLTGPMDAEILPGGRVLIAEGNGLSERDTKGTILWQKKIEGGPTGVQRLPNGNTFVSMHGSVLEFDKNGNQVYKFVLPTGSNAIRKHKNGNIVYATDAEIVEIDTDAKKVRSLPVPRDGMWVGIQDLPGDRFLVANSTSGRVLEVNRSGKILWESRVAGACGIARLPSGNTLVATAGRIVELNRAGRQIWEKKSDGYVRRVHRR